MQAGDCVERWMSPVAAHGVNRVGGWPSAACLKPRGEGGSEVCGEWEALPGMCL